MKLPTLISRSFMIAGIALLVVGCKQRLDYMVQNESGQKLTEVRAQINDDHEFLHGRFNGNGGSGFGGAAKLRDENVVVISWILETGEAHSQTLTVPLSEFTDGRLVMFVITESMTVTRR